MKNIVVVDDDFMGLDAAVRALGVVCQLNIGADGGILVPADENYNNLDEDLTVEIGNETVRVLATQDPKRALELLSEETALLLTDYMMPGMDGVELYRAAADKFPQLPVIMRTGTPSIAKEKLTGAKILFVGKGKEDHLLQGHLLKVTIA